MAISVVLPVYNEESVLEELASRLNKTLKETNLPYEIIFVDDGSKDNSFVKLAELHARYRPHLKIIKLSRNFGHQIAITSGLKNVSGKAVVVMDSDLQDPPEVIQGFVAKWKEGNEIVLAVRSKREGESFFKKWTAGLFYKLIRFATNVNIAENVGDFYLLDRKVVDILNQMDERHRFLRGMVAWAGFKRATVEYVRKPRKAGSTKFGFWRMIKFSFDAATSFSFLPLRIISFLGFSISLLSFLGILVSLYLKIFTDQTVTGWTSLTIFVLFIGGIQLLAIGVIGEYVARIGDDIKRRPLYVVDQILEP
ncbi:MAG: glycosyltransferase [Omnitrophica WOR_2 bacterium GWA2_47_8]|nr:MAG: glycosyltransferase [Omnitrophica WOR_2 bacterium GWA2_47_8]